MVGREAISHISHAGCCFAWPQQYYYHIFHIMRPRCMSLISYDTHLLFLHPFVRGSQCILPSYHSLRDPCATRDLSQKLLFLTFTFNTNLSFLFFYFFYLLYIDTILPINSMFVYKQAKCLEKQINYHLTSFPSFLLFI